MHSADPDLTRTTPGGRLTFDVPNRGDPELRIVGQHDVDRGDRDGTGNKGLYPTIVMRPMDGTWEIV